MRRRNCLLCLIIQWNGEKSWCKSNGNQFYTQIYVHVKFRGKSYLKQKKLKLEPTILSSKLFSDYFVNNYILRWIIAYLALYLYGDLNHSLCILLSLGKHGLWDKYPRPIRSQTKFLYLSTKTVLISKSKQNSAIFWHWHEWHFTCVLPDKGTLVLKRYQAVLKQIFCPLLILRKCCWKYLTLTITFWWLSHNNNNTIHD